MTKDELKVTLNWLLQLGIIDIGEFNKILIKSLPYLR